jgi:hypothetical protein
MLTTRGWGGAGGLISVSGFGGFFLVVPAVVQSLSLTPELQGVVNTVRCMALSKITPADLGGRLSEVGASLGDSDSILLDLETRLQRLESLTHDELKGGMPTWFSLELDDLTRSKLDVGTFNTLTGAQDQALGVLDSQSQDILARLRKLEWGLRLYRRQRRTP